MDHGEQRLRDRGDQRFAGVEAATTAFAANLLGAMAGGTLEYLSLITGYQFLVIVTAVLYGLAFLTGRRRASTATIRSGPSPISPPI